MTASIAEADAPLSEATQASKPRRLRGDLSSRSSLGRESGQDEAQGSSRRVARLNSAARTPYYLLRLLKETPAGWILKAA